MGGYCFTNTWSNPSIEITTCTSRAVHQSLDSDRFFSFILTSSSQSRQSVQLEETDSVWPGNFGILDHGIMGGRMEKYLAVPPESNFLLVTSTSC